MWNKDEAHNLIILLKPLLQEVGWGIGLTGSLLLNKSSTKDLDLILYPINKSKINYNNFRLVLESQGMNLKWNKDKIASFWKRKQSTDTKHVEVWYLRDKRIDIFVLS